MEREEKGWAGRKKPRVRFSPGARFRKESRGKAYRVVPDRASGDLKMKLE